MGLNHAALKARREAIGLTQAEAAKLAGMANQAAWQQIESGVRANPTIDTVQRMAKALGVKVDELLK